MFCPICGAELDENAKDCYVCGYHLNGDHQNSSDHVIAGERKCHVCGFALNAEDSICPVCNTPVELSANEESYPEEIRSGEVVQPEEFTKQPKKNTTLKIIVPILIFLLLAIGVGVFVILKGSDGAENSANTDSNEQTRDETEKEDTDTKEETESINKADYLGYWNIRNNTERELTIHNISNTSVEFSLWYYRLDEVENVSASLEGNVASFSVRIDRRLLSGTLTLNKDSIEVQITQSERMYMPVELMTFAERHEISWQYGSYSFVDDPNYSQYILPDSSGKILTYEDIRHLSAEQLKLARNEIYARHGRIFKDAALRAYFESQSWYMGIIQPDDFSESMLSEIEKSNVKFIMSYE